MLGREWTKGRPEEKDLGMLADQKLSVTCSPNLSWAAFRAL